MWTKYLSPDQRRTALERIGLASTHILSIVDDVLDLARVEAGAMPIVLCDVDTDSVIAETLDLIQPLADQRGVIIWRTGRTATVLADRRRLRQVMLNLLSNAIRFSPPASTVRVVRLTDDDARNRLAVHDHGILCTVHPVRGVDAVPVSFGVDDDGFVAVPVDLVKPKESLRLQRERNLEADPRATLLVESWNRDDWSQLWWVRAELIRHVDADLNAAGLRETALAARLADRYPQYRGQPFDRLLVLHIVGVTGWAAT